MSQVEKVLPGVSLSRISIPTPNPSFLMRVELLEKIRSNASQINLLIAPSGFGKTSLAAQWANENPQNTIWYAADKADTPLISLLHVIQGLRKIHKNFAPWAEDLTEGNFDIQKDVVRFVNELSQTKSIIRIVFDNMDNLSGSDHFDLNATWLANSPKNIQTLSIRHTQPNIFLNQSQNIQSINIIGAKELKFTKDEILQLNEILRISISDQETLHIFDDLNGWPAGIHMLQKFIKNGETLDFENLPPHDTNKILLNTTLKSLKSDELKLLKSICLLEIVDGDLAKKISENINADSILRRIAAAETFIVRDTSSNDSYKIIPLIRLHLIEQIKAEGKFIETAKICFEAIKERDSIQAFDLLIKSGDLEKAKNFALKNIRNLIFSGKQNQIEAFEEIVSQVIGASNAQRLLLRAYLEVNAGELAKSKNTILEYQSRYKNSPDFEKLKDDAALVQSRISFLEGDFKAVANGAFQNFDGLSKVVDDMVNARILSNLQIAVESAYLLEEVLTTKKLIEKINSFPKSESQLVNSFYIPSALALIEHASGNLREAKENANLAIAAANLRRASGLFLPYAAAYCLADIHREEGKFEEAIEILEEYILHAKKFNIKPWLVALMAKRALIFSHQGRNSEALAMISNARSEIDVTDSETNKMGRVIDEHEVLIRTSLGDEARIIELLFRLPQGELFNAYSTVYEAGKSPSKIEKLLAEFPADTARRKLQKAFVAANIFADNPKVANKYLMTATDIATANGFFIVFLQQQPKVLNLLIEMAGRQPTVFMQSLAGRIRNQINNGSLSISNIKTTLTKRELDILRRLSTGLPITQIASTLHISHNTIKTHLKSVYRKLEVESRQEAVAKAANLALL